MTTLLSNKEDYIMIDEKLEERLVDVINVALDDYLSADDAGKSNASKNVATFMDEYRKIKELEQNKLDADNRLEAEINKADAELELKESQMKAELEKAQAELEFKKEQESKNRKILIASSIGVPVCLAFIKEMFKLHFADKISEWENSDYAAKTPSKSVREWFSWK